MPVSTKRQELNVPKHNTLQVSVQAHERWQYKVSVSKSTNETMPLEITARMCN